MDWKTIKKYLDDPAQGPSARERRSKLDSFKAVIAEWLEKDPVVTSALIQQRLTPLGYAGGHTILQEYVRKLRRPQLAPKRAFVRMEPSAGERFEVDWGHFDALNYSGDIRKLYAFACWWMRTAGCCMSNSRTASLSKRSGVATFMPFMHYT